MAHGSTIWSSDRAATLLLTSGYPEFGFSTPQPATLAYSFPNVTSCFGISEIGDDVLAVVVGNFSAKNLPAGSASFSVQKLDFTKSDSEENARALGVTNGFGDRRSCQMLEPDNNTLSQGWVVLIADSPKGVIWKVDTKTGDYSVALNDTTMAPAKAGSSSGCQCPDSTW